MRKKYKTVLKRFISVALAFVLIFGAAPISEFTGLDFSWLKAEAAGNYSFDYTVKNNEVTINRLILNQINSSEIIVPATIEGYPVTAIGAYCFIGFNSENPFIKRIELPLSIKTIGNNAFANLVALESVNLPKNLDVISYNLFSRCSSLKEITIPKTVTTIGARAFSDCSSLTNLNIPESVKTIGIGAFSGCSSLMALSISGNVEKLGSGFAAFCTNIKEINVDPSNKLYKSVDGIVFTSNLKRLIQYPAGRESLSYKIPNSVSEIGKSAFAGNKYISDICFNNSVNRIYDSAFYDCENISNITLPKSLKKIYSNAFYNCKKLENVDFNIGLKSIGNSAFEGCIMLKNVTLPYTIEETTDIGGCAFKGIYGLEIFLSGEMHCPDYYDVIPFETDTIIYGKEGSDAQRFAQLIGCKFVAKHNPITKITLEHEDLTINRTSYGQEAVSLLAVNIEPMDFTEDINWKSSDESVAKIAGRSLGPEGYDNGNYLYPNGIGTATVKIYSKDANASCKVIVNEPVGSITLPQKTDVRIGESKNIVASVKPDNASNKNLRWESSNPSIVKVNEKTGAITGISKGEAVVTAYSTDGTYEAQKHPCSNPVDPMDPSGEYYESQEPTPLNAKCMVKVIDPPHYVSSTEGFESKHNYDNNTIDSWIYKSKGAENITLTFDTRTSVEEDFDFIYILDKNGQEVGRFTGKELAGESVKVMGDTVEVKLVADQSINDWGFKVTDIKLNAKKQTPLMSGTKIYNKNEDDADFNLDINTNSDGLITYKSSNPNVATVDSNGNVKILGQGNTTITVTSAETKDFKSTDMVVEVNVGVGGGLNITSQPQNFYGHKNEKATFTVHAYGDGLKYQWQYSDNRGKTWLNTYAKGSATNSITVNMDAMRVDRLFRCKITDKYGDAVYSDVVIMALKKSDIDIVSQPKSYSGKSFDAVRFHVEAQGENLTYRWLCSSDGGKTWKKTYLLGYNTDTLKVRLFKHRENTMYKCVITSAGENSVETTVATLTKKAK